MDLALIACTLVAASSLSASTDSIHALDEVSVSYRTHPQGMRYDNGSLHISARSLIRGFRSFGEADALAAAKMMPGYSASSDYSGGLSVNGGAYGDNVYVLDGIRVFFPYRFGGVFSDFNPYHLHQVVISQSPSVSAPGALGAYVIGSTSDIVPDSVGGIANVGLVASSLTLKMPFSGATALTLSVRRSYINVLYDALYHDDGNSLGYGFTDINATLLHRLDVKSCLRLSALYSDDALTTDNEDYVLDTHLSWRNKGISLSYESADDRISQHYTLSTSSLTSVLDMSMPQMALNVPSHVKQISAVGETDFIARGWSLGYRAEYNVFDPQQVATTGVKPMNVSDIRYTSWLIASGASRRWSITRGTITGQLRISAYGCGDYGHLSLDPRLTYHQQNAMSAVDVSISAATQYMHQATISDIGLASNYYLPALSVLPPTRAYTLDGLYSIDRLTGWLGIRAHGFASLVYDGTEYMGGLLGMLDMDYDPLTQIYRTEGYNVGGDVSADIRSGAVSANASYSIAICRRRLVGADTGWFSSATEPLHSLKLLAEWHLNDRLSISGHFLLSSGRPFTPVEAIFMVGGNVLTEYGPHNSERLPSYHRLDMSATYRLPPMHIGTRTVQSFVNLSMFNVYGHRNIEMQYFNYDKESHSIRLRQVASVFRFLPSLSYTVEF